MKDHFDAKRGMVKQLLDMLKAHASNEVSTGLQHPEGEGDMHGIQAERVEVLPEHEMDEPTPEHEVITHELNEGGVVEDVSNGGYPAAPSKKIEAGNGQPDKPGAVQKEAGESVATREAATTEENEEPLGTEYEDAVAEPSSMFASFLSRKKKK